MTREGIIEQLESIIGTYEILTGNGVNSDMLGVDDIEAIRETIKTLKAEPCEDAISRAAAVEGLGECPLNWTDSPEELQAIMDWEETKEMLEELPPVCAVIEIDGKKYRANDPKLKTKHKLGECVIGGFYEEDDKK